MDNKTKSLQQEKNELNSIVNKGVSFEVEDIEFEVKKKLFGIWKKRIPVKVMRQFNIKEPTLAILDRLSVEWIEFAIDENALKTEDVMQRARILTREHSIRCARVIAIAVLGPDILIPKYGRSGAVHYIEDEKRLQELTALFSRQIKPSTLYQLYVLINAMCNFGDFLNSIRLMSSDRSAMPIRIEENSED